MDPTDFADVTGYTFTYLMNGLSPAGNWTGLVSSRGGGAAAIHQRGGYDLLDVRIPGLAMTVVQVDGQNVQPVVVDEFRIGAGGNLRCNRRTAEDRAYTLFAETMDRSGYARGTLAPRTGMTADIPARRPAAPHHGRYGNADGPRRHEGHGHAGDEAERS